MTKLLLRRRFHDRSLSVGTDNKNFFKVECCSKTAQFIQID